MRYLPLVVAITVLFGGCLPASRVQHNSNARNAYTEALENAMGNASISSERRSILNTAEGWLGTPYRYGGTATSGVDCSGFTSNVFAANDIRLPRTSSMQANEGAEVSRSEALPGDLVFFNTFGSGVSHVGIMVDAERFIHASTSAGVIVSSLNETYYHDRLLFIRRVLLN